jgi:hypothetical protein
MKDIKELAKSKMAKLTKKDIVVLWGGSNDVAKNNSVVGMKHILDLVINSSHTNVILMNVPHRHDLIKDSCVNREVEAFNRKLRNRLKCFKKLELIEVDSERELYTRQGQHLNSRGKENIASKIALTIERVVKRKVDPISIKWYDDEELDSQKHQDQTTQESSSSISITTDVIHNANNDPEEEEEEVKHSEPLITTDKKQELAPKHVKRQPVTRGDDFLWEA